MAWRDLAAGLQQASVRAFDYGDVSFQKRDGTSNVGDPVPIPADYAASFLELGGGDKPNAVTRSPVVDVDFGVFPEGVRPEQGDLIVVASGEAAGTYEIDTAEPNDDRTGAVLHLRKH